MSIGAHARPRGIASAKDENSGWEQIATQTATASRANLALAPNCRSVLVLMAMMKGLYLTRPHSVHACYRPSGRFSAFFASTEMTLSRE